MIATSVLLLMTASVSSLPSAASAPSASASHWRVVWQDDFSGDSLDRSKWVPEESCWGGGNQERQCYTDRRANIEVADGVLRLIAQPESYVGARYPAHNSLYDADDKVRQEYTSGKINTVGLADWTYGRFSARMKLPAGQGTWPAFWMLPTANTYGAWPLSGEIDIMEAVNLEVSCIASRVDCPRGGEQRTSGAIHFGDYAPNNSYIYSFSDKAKAPAQEWHVYSIEWAEGVIQWFVDGQIFMRATPQDWYSASAAARGVSSAPFDKSFYLSLNYAVGGNLAERGELQGFDAASFPSALQVDWVRVEQCAGDESGRACLSDAPWQGTLHRHGARSADSAPKEGAS